MKENGITHVQIGMPGNKEQEAENVDRKSHHLPSFISLCRSLALEIFLIAELFSRRLFRNFFCDQVELWWSRSGRYAMQSTSSANAHRSAATARVPDEKITAALFVILDKVNHPLLIHCNKGKVCA